MTIDARRIDYEHNGTMLEGYLARDDSIDGPVPGVLVAHTWSGRGDFECVKARALAELGYAGFALDLYGKGLLGGSPEENAELMQPFLDDRGLLLARLQRAVATLRAQPEVDPGRVAAVGFCFGGLCVLDLARGGGDVAGVVSFHGLLMPPGGRGNAKIAAKVLALHGWDDPMAPPDQAQAFAQEMTAAGADWQLHAYGNTMHAFTNPDANDPAAGTVYDAAADRRSWAAMRSFLAELL